jgi:hypothetical protein
LAVNPAARLFSQEDIKQIVVWGVLFQLIEPLLRPLVTEIAQETNGSFPNIALPVSQAADSVVKGHITMEQGAHEAAQYGFSKENFKLMVDSLGEPPGLELLLALFRREIIPEKGTGAASVSLEQGIKESRLKDKWIPVLEQARTVPIPPSDAIAAWLRGQIGEAEAKKLAYQGGIDDHGATILYNSSGRPPSPTELNVLYRRGLIPLAGTGPDQLTVQQGIYEGDTKDKWWHLFAELAVYLPPPRTVTALLREGALTDAQALHLFQQSGLSAELAGIYVAAAHHQKTAVDRELVKSDVLTLYMDKIISRTDAGGLLVALHYSAHDAEWLLDVADFRQEQKLITHAVTRVHSQYTAHKISKTQAMHALDQLSLPHAQRDQLLLTWDLERGLYVHTLTPTQVASAMTQSILTEGEAMEELTSMGYSAFDAWVLLATHNKGPLAIPRPPKQIAGQ